MNSDRNLTLTSQSTTVVADFSNAASTGGSLPMIETALTSRHGRIFKRTLDVVFSLPVVCLMLPPVVLIAWISQRMQSPGPLFFKQERCGVNKKKFTILKIRTMNEVKSEEESDPEARIFPIGDILRKTKLDEVPQFVNVLAGSMSIVGPRPHHFEDCANFEKAVKDYSQRTIAKPGITGWAQYKEYRGDFQWNCVENRVKRDLAYIHQWSLYLDIKLIVKTANIIQRKSTLAVFRKFAIWRRPEKTQLSLFLGPEDVPKLDESEKPEKKAA